MKANKRQTVATALALTFLSHAVLAQAAGGDIHGVQTPVGWAVAAFKVIAGLGIVWGFMRLMSGRHTIEGLVIMAVGALGIAKSDAITAGLGL